MVKPYRYRLFGGFRLVLALCVVVQHFVANAAPLGSLYAFVLPYEIGSLAVLVFFCLSGFVITEAACLIYSRRPWAYLTNRLLRIVPQFLLAVAIAIPVHYWFFTQHTLRLSDREHPDAALASQMFDWSNILANAFGFLPGAKRFMTYDFVSVIWAVRIEMIFYFAVFIALLLAPRFRLSRLLPAVLLGLGLGMFIAPQFGYFFFFLYGVLLYDWRCHPVGIAACMIGMCAHFLLHPPAHDASYVRAVVPQLILLTATLGLMTWLALRTVRLNRLDQRCGDLSYPLYVQHENVAVLLLSATVGYSYLYLGIGIGMAVLVSYGLMLCLDPVINQLRDLTRGQRLDRPTASQTDGYLTAAVVADAAPVKQPLASIG